MVVNDEQWLIMGNGNDDWLVVWNIFYFPIYWELSSQLTNIFQRGSNHQPDDQYNIVFMFGTGIEFWMSQPCKI